MKALVIFDMDGVLINSEPVHMRLERELFARLSLQVSDEEHYSYVGMSPRGMWAEIKSRHGLQQEIDALVAMEAATKVREIGKLPIQAIDGVERLLRTLKANGHDLAIASSSPKALIDAVSAKLDLGRYFAHSVSGEEVAKGKPHPDIFLRTADICGRSPAHCVVIEDSSNGMRAALAAGMRCIGYANRHSGKQDLSKADMVVEDFGVAASRQITEFLRTIDASQESGGPA